MNVQSAKNVTSGGNSEILPEKPINWLDQQLPKVFLTVASLTIVLVFIKVVFQIEHYWVKESLNYVILAAAPLSLADYCRMGISRAGNTPFDIICIWVLKIIQVLFGYIGFFVFLIVAGANDISAYKHHFNDIQQHLIYVKYEDLLLTLGALSTVLFLFTLSGDKQAKVSAWVWMTLGAVGAITLSIILASNSFFF
jgi:hypothetical protein